MKRKFTCILAALLLAAIPLSVYAGSTTTLTTTVPAATYTLNIPADQTIEFGKTISSIGNVTVSDSDGFAEGKNLEVKFIYDYFKCENVTTTIPYRITVSTLGASTDTDTTIVSGDSLYFKGTNNGTVEETGYIDNIFCYPAKSLSCTIKSSDWGKALAGEYSSSITFTAEVYVED